MLALLIRRRDDPVVGSVSRGPLGWMTRLSIHRSGARHGARGQHAPTQAYQYSIALMTGPFFAQSSESAFAVVAVKQPDIHRLCQNWSSIAFTALWQLAQTVPRLASR